MPYLVRPDGSICAETLAEAMALSRVLSQRGMTALVRPETRAPARRTARPPPEPVTSFDALLIMLADAIPRPAQRTGRPRADQALMLRTAVAKVRSGASGRAVSADGAVPHGTLAKYMAWPRMTSALTLGVNLSAEPLRAMDTGAHAESATFHASGRGGHTARRPSSAIGVTAMVGDRTGCFFAVRVSPFLGATDGPAWRALKAEMGTQLVGKTARSQENEILLRCLCVNLTALAADIPDGTTAPAFWSRSTG